MDGPPRPGQAAGVPLPRLTPLGSAALVGLVILVPTLAVAVWTGTREVAGVGLGLFGLAFTVGLSSTALEEATPPTRVEELHRSLLIASPLCYLALVFGGATERWRAMNLLPWLFHDGPFAPNGATIGGGLALACYLVVLALRLRLHQP